MIVLPPTREGLATAVAALRVGEIVAHPTETVYGLAVDPFNESALERLFRVKGRNPDQPVLLIVSDEDQLARVTARVSDRARRYMAAFWPGPLSLLFPKAPGVPDILTAGQPKVCVRCPGADVARALCRVFGGALTSTSANLSGQPPAVRVADLQLDGVACAIDAGELGQQPPSTVFDPDTGAVLREGAISAAALQAIPVD